MKPSDEEIQNVLRDAVADLTKGHAKHAPASEFAKEYCELCLEDWPCPNITVSHTLTDFANEFEPAPEKIEATGPYRWWSDLALRGMEHRRRACGLEPSRLEVPLPSRSTAQLESR